MENNDKIQSPHDKFIRETLKDPGRMAALLKQYLPKSLTDNIQWHTLQFEHNSFLDEHLRERHCDLLFSVELLASRKVYLYLLFEHQRSPDPTMALRILRYMVRAWERFEVKLPAQRLPLILPIVFYQNDKPWPYSNTFRDLVEIPQAEAGQWIPFLPDFQFYPLNLSELDLANIGHNGSVQVILKLLRAILHKDPQKTLDEGFNALEQIHNAPDTLSFLRTCLTYLTEAASEVDPRQFIDHIKTLKSNHIKEATMTIAERLIEHGVEKGRNEGWTNGLNRGREEGRTLGERLLLQRQLEKRFGPLSGTQAQRLESADLHTLETWGTRIFDITSAQELLGP